MKKLLVMAGVALAVLAIGCGGEDPPPPIVVPPTADFSWLPSNPDIAQATNFTDESTDGDGNIDTWAWTFTGGTPASSAVQSPTGVTFGSAGFTGVTLTVTDDNSKSDSITKQVPIRDPGDVTAPDLDVTEVIVKGTATDNVAVTSLTDNKGVGTIALDGTANEASEPFETHAVTMGSGSGDSAGSVIISADDDAGTGPTNRTVTIDEDLNP